MPELMGLDYLKSVDMTVLDKIITDSAKEGEHIKNENEKKGVYDYEVNCLVNSVIAYVTRRSRFSDVEVTTELRRSALKSVLNLGWNIGYKVPITDKDILKTFLSKGMKKEAAHFKLLCSYIWGPDVLTSLDNVCEALELSPERDIIMESIMFAMHHEDVAFVGELWSKIYKSITKGSGIGAYAVPLVNIILNKDAKDFKIDSNMVNNYNGHLLTLIQGKAVDCAISLEKQGYNWTAGRIWGNLDKTAELRVLFEKMEEEKDYCSASKLSGELGMKREQIEYMLLRAEYLVAENISTPLVEPSDCFADAITLAQESGDQELLEKVWARIKGSEAYAELEEKIQEHVKFNKEFEEREAAEIKILAI